MGIEKLYLCQISSDTKGNCTIRTPNGSVIVCQERTGGCSFARQIMQVMSVNWTDNGFRRGMYRASCQLTGDQLDMMVKLGEADHSGYYSEEVIAFVRKHLSENAERCLRYRNQYL